MTYQNLKVNFFLKVTNAVINVAYETQTEIKTHQFFRQWLDETGYRVTQIEADRNQVTVLINGSGETPSLSELDPSLQPLIEGNNLIIRIVPSQTILYPEILSN